MPSAVIRNASIILAELSHLRRKQFGAVCLAMQKDDRRALPLDLYIEVATVCAKIAHEETPQFALPLEN
jgi:3,4-dihydroxy-2-butanone 4-phosphate synthase